jgi:hypothetical protein
LLNAIKYSKEEQTIIIEVKFVYFKQERTLRNLDESSNLKSSGNSLKNFLVTKITNVGVGFKDPNKKKFKTFAFQNTGVN